MTETSFSPAALDDLKGIVSYVSHELGSPRAALDTIDRIVSKAEGLSTFPRRGAPLDSICPVHNVIAVNIRWYITCRKDQSIIINDCTVRTVYDSVLVYITSVNRKSYR